MKNFLKKNRLNIFLSLLLIAGFLTRVFFVDKVIVGDLMNYAEWGEKLVQNGPKGYYYSEGWYFSTPVYPPVSIVSFAADYWLNEHRYVLAQLHNVTKFPPSAFIIYFYKFGYVFLLKLLPILCDLGISILIYKLIFELTKSRKRAIYGFLFFILNPIVIFMSGAWGQTDSVVGILGLLSFLFLIKGNITFSIPIMFLSLYFKPSWAVLIPFYLFIIYKLKPGFKKFILGLFLSLLLFVVFTQPFAEGNVFSYGYKLFREKYPLPIGIVGKASISAFNFQTIFFKVDIDYSSEKILGVKSSMLGTALYIIINIWAFKTFAKQKNKLLGMLSGIFIIGFGSFLFMATMLERYFFPALAPMIILMFVEAKTFWNIVVMNIILAANIIYSFYRRGSDEIAHPFIDNNFLVIRVLSLLQFLNFMAVYNKIKKI